MHVYGHFCTCTGVVFVLYTMPLFQETMEDVYIHRLPHLCWFTLHTLCCLEQLAIKPRSLQHCLELLLFCTQKIVQEATKCYNSTTSPATGTCTMYLCYNKHCWLVGVTQPIMVLYMYMYMHVIRVNTLSNIESFFSFRIGYCHL